MAQLRGITEATAFTPRCDQTTAFEMGQQEQSPLGHKKQNDKGENHRDDHLQRRITSILGSARRTQPLHSAHFGGAMMALSGPKKTAIAHKWVPGVSNCPRTVGLFISAFRAIPMFRALSITAPRMSPSGHPLYRPRPRISPSGRLPSLENRLACLELKGPLRVASPTRLS